MDIRLALNERLKTIAKERAKLDEIEAGIKALLKLEDDRDSAFSTHRNKNGHSADAGQFVLDALNQSKRSLTVEDMKQWAQKAKFNFGEKSPGRVLHWALVSKKRAGIVEKVNGKWRLKEVAQ